jgi:signal transduction histidine kinase
MYILVCVLIICVGVLAQNICYNLFGTQPIYFEYFIYIGTCFLPTSIFYMVLILKNTKFTFKRAHLLLLIVPIISIIILWTNNYHHLFYVKYSLNINEAIVGPYFYIHSIYTYALLLISIILLIQTSLKTSGVFSKQTVLLIIGTSIPIIVNLLGTTKIINMNVYLTPISFSITIFIYGLAILKFNFLDVSPIALQRIVNVMSDSYVVLNVNNSIVDYNKTFIEASNCKNKSIRKLNFFKLFKIEKDSSFYKTYVKAVNLKKTLSFNFYEENLEKYFTVEISPLINNKTFIGTLILFKDITQHVNDMKKIKDAQESLMEAERLSSLGQLIGGIAHNLKTPIMSIAGAAEGLNDLIKEYDSSIDDPEVNSHDHHEIAQEMSEWIVKIKQHTEYMSDVITTVKGQAATLSESENISFDLEELVKRIDILMKHELKNSLTYMRVQMNVPKETVINGDINSLVQVINNMISNSIQSYNGKTEQNIDLIFEKKRNNIIISVKDYGCGLPKKVQDKLFKEMITTKGKNGTGLGLYMSYSTIKAHFNGNITFETEEGKGTTFNITLPL